MLLDETLKPWLIEVNASPSLTADTPSDYKLKFGLLEDLFGVVDMEGLRQPGDIRVGGFDLIWADGAPVNAPSPCGAPTCIPPCLPSATSLFPPRVAAAIGEAMTPPCCQRSPPQYNTPHTLCTSHAIINNHDTDHRHLYHNNTITCHHQILT